MEDKKKEILGLQKMLLIERQARLLAEFELTKRDLSYIENEIKNLGEEKQNGNDEVI